MQATQPLPLLPWAPANSAPIVPPALLAGLRAGAHTVISTPTIPLARHVDWLPAPSHLSDTAPWPGRLGAAGQPLRLGPRSPLAADALVRRALDRAHDIAWLEHLARPGNASRYAIPMHGAVRTISTRAPPPRAGPHLQRPRAPPAGLRRPRDRVSFSPCAAPPARRTGPLPAGCGEADAQAHTLQSCARYATAYIQRDRAVRPLGETLRTTGARRPRSGQRGLGSAAGAPTVGRRRRHRAHPCGDVDAPRPVGPGGQPSPCARGRRHWRHGCLASRCRGQKAAHPPSPHQTSVDVAGPLCGGGTMFSWYRRSSRPAHSPRRPGLPVRPRPPSAPQTCTVRPAGLLSPVY